MGFELLPPAELTDSDKRKRREMQPGMAALHFLWLYFSRIAFLISSEGPQDILTKYSPDEAD